MKLVIFRKLTCKKLLGGLPLALALLPPLLLIQTTANFAVNVPVIDSLDLAPEMVKLHYQGLSFGDFLVREHEHPVFFARLLFLGLAALDGWDLVRDTFIFSGLQLLSMVLLLVLLRRTVGGRLWPWLALPGSALLFSEGALPFNNIFNIVWFQLDFLALLAITLLYRWPGRWPALLAAMAVCSLASFSLASGMALWLALLPGLLLPENGWKKPQRLLWLAASAFFIFIVVLFYYFGSDNAGKLSFLAHGFEVVFYFLAWLGGPFGSWAGLAAKNLAAAAGLAGLTSGGLVIYYLWDKAVRAGILPLRKLLPWLQLQLLVLLTAAAAAAGRINPAQSQNRLYLATSGLFWLAWGVLLALALRAYRGRAARGRARLKPLLLLPLAMALAAGYLLTYITGYTRAVQWNNYQEFSYYYIQQPDQAPEIAWETIYAAPREAQDWLLALQQVQEGPYRQPPAVVYRQLEQKWAARLTPRRFKAEPVPPGAITFNAPAATVPDESSAAAAYTFNSTGAGPLEIDLANNWLLPRLKNNGPLPGLPPGYENQALDIQLKQAWYLKLDFKNLQGELETALGYGLPGENGWKHFRVYLPAYARDLKITLFYQPPGPVPDNLKIDFYHLFHN